MALDQLNLEELLDQLRKDHEPDLDTITLSSLNTDPLPSITITGMGSDPAYGAVPTYSVGSNMSATGISWSPNTTPNVTISQPIWTTANPYSAMGAGATVSQGGKIKLEGDGADVDINGKSLKSWMEQVEQRLNILTPNPELEKDWDDLRKLGERYRKLEKKCQEKAEVWKKLKSLPKVEVK